MIGRVNLNDVQGIILRGYNFDQARHYVLKIVSPEKARQAIAHLVDASSNIRITSADSTSFSSNGEYRYALNIGFTYSGLEALGLSEQSLRTFKSAAPAFAKGAKRRAPFIGDIGPSAPEHWHENLRNENDAHALCSLYANSTSELDKFEDLLKSKFGLNGSTEPSVEIVDEPFEGKHLKARSEKRKEHFGFRDGIEQPQIRGVFIPGRPPHSNLPTIETGAFLLGYPSQWDEFSYPLPTPGVLGFNGSFAAFRVLSQDVAGFNEYAGKKAQSMHIKADTIKAKMMGRWPSGAPITNYPDFDEGPNYTKKWFDFSNDTEGLRCPLGAHIRRSNPRADRIAGDISKDKFGNVSVKRRIIRRGMPYGEPYEKGSSTDRGLLGIFVCASLEDQFEFLMMSWLNKGGFNGGLPSDSRDPIVGANDGRSSKFCIPTDSEKKTADAIPAFVTTKGGLYCFYPSMSALGFIGSI